MIKLTKLQQDGSLYTLKYILIFVILLAVVGAVFGITKVLLFEQSPNGRSSTVMACTRWDNACINTCEKTKDEDVSCSYCCTHSRFIPLGERQMEQAKFFALIFGIGPGLVLGMTIGQERWKK